MSKNVLVKQSGPSVFQQVGAMGDRPRFRDFKNTFMAPRGTVSRGQRLRGLAGMAGKGAAMAATAQQTAERMQGGDFTAPLQVGVTYQGIDPTGTMNPDISQQISARNRVGVTSVPLPAAGGAANDPKLGQSQFRNESPAMAKIRQERLGLTGPPPAPAGPIPLPVAVAPTQAAPAPAPTQAAPAPAPTQAASVPQTNQFGMGTGGANMLNQIPSSLPPVSTATPPNMGLLQAQQLMGQPQQQQQGHGTTYPPGYAPTPYHEISGLNPTLGDSVNWKAFTDTVFDKLGPDMVYKMTPHQLGTLSAYMYLKLS